MTVARHGERALASSGQSGSPMRRQVRLSMSVSTQSHVALLHAQWK